MCQQTAFDGIWSVWKYVKEPEFGPGPVINTLFIVGFVKSKEGIIAGIFQ